MHYLFGRRILLKIFLCPTQKQTDFDTYRTTQWMLILEILFDLQNICQTYHHL